MWPTRAMVCSTPQTTLSLTHLSIRLFAAKMNNGPAMNLPTEGTYYQVPASCPGTHDYTGSSPPHCAHICVDCYSPQGSHDVEWIVESCLLWIVFQCEYGGVHEHPPSYDAQEDNSIAGRRLIQVQYLSRIKELYGMARKIAEWLFLSKNVENLCC